MAGTPSEENRQLLYLKKILSGNVCKREESIFGDVFFHKMTCYARKFV